MINQLADKLSRPGARVAVVLKTSEQRDAAWSKFKPLLEKSFFNVTHQHRAKGIADQQAFFLTEEEVVARSPVGMLFTNILYDWRVGSAPIEWLRTLIRSPDFDSAHFSVEQIEG